MILKSKETINRVAKELYFVSELCDLVETPKGWEAEFDYSEWRGETTKTLLIHFNEMIDNDKIGRAIAYSVQISPNDIEVFLEGAWKGGNNYMNSSDRGSASIKSFEVTIIKAKDRQIKEIADFISSCIIGFNAKL